MVINSLVALKIAVLQVFDWFEAGLNGLLGF